MPSGNHGRHPTDAVAVFWLLGLFAITALGVLPLFLYRLDLSKLTFSTPVPVVVGIGIEVTAYAPTLAALLVVAFVQGAGASSDCFGPLSGGGLACPGISSRYSVHRRFS